MNRGVGRARGHGVLWRGAVMANNGDDETKMNGDDEQECMVLWVKAKAP
jgi:hypothetical protein